MDLAYLGYRPSGINAAPRSTNTLLASPARDQTLPRVQAPNPVAASAGNIPAAAHHAAQAAPAKRKVGRPKGSGNKCGKQVILTYRCRYGCWREPMTDHIALRSHMQRKHGIFSNEHDGKVRRCDCGRLFSMAQSDAPCTQVANGAVKRNGDLKTCKPMSDEEVRLRSIIPPRDEQEMSDTFGLAPRGPYRRAPSELVVVLPGHDEAERRWANQDAIRLWDNRSPDERARAAPIAVLDNSGLAAPETTPSESPQSPIGLTGEDEVLLPAPVSSKKRAAEESLPEPAPKRFAETTDAAPRRDSFTNAMAFLESYEPNFAPDAAEGAALFAAPPNAMLGFPEFDRAADAGFADMQAHPAHPAAIASGSSDSAVAAESTQPNLDGPTAADGDTTSAPEEIDFSHWLENASDETFLQSADAFFGVPAQ